MAIRRITVTVRWKEGPNDRELPLTQFVTDPARGGFAGSALMGDGGAMDFSDTTSSGSGGNKRPNSSSSSSGGASSSGGGKP
jgi:hypothetical protein